MKAMPWENRLATTDTEKFYHALSNFARTFAFKPDDRLVFLTDKLLDPRVVSAISGLALAQGIRPVVVQVPSTNMLEIPDEVNGLFKAAAAAAVSDWRSGCPST